MTLWDDLLVDGVSLSNGLPDGVSEGLCLDGPWAWPYQMADQRGDLPIYLGIDGLGYADQPYAAQVLPIPATLTAPPCDDEGSPTEQSDDTWAWLNNAIQLLQVACKPDRLVTLTRRRSLPSSGEAAHTARAKLLRITPGRPVRDTLRLVIEFNQLDGIWHDADDTALDPITGTDTVTIGGTTRTFRITIHVAAGAVNPRITNLTNDYAVRWVGTVPAGGLDIDVEARTAHLATTGSPDVTAGLTWTKNDLLRLDPGENELQVSTGTATLTYTPAYL